MSDATAAEGCTRRGGGSPRGILGTLEAGRRARGEGDHPENVFVIMGREEGTRADRGGEAVGTGSRHGKPPRGAVDGPRN